MKRKKHISGSNRPRKFPAPVGDSASYREHLKGEKRGSEKEKVFNLFLFVVHGLICEIGAVCHLHAGTDANKIAFLQAQAMADYSNAKRYTVPDRYIVVTDGIEISNRLTYAGYLRLSQAGRHTEVFDEAFQDFGASSSPLICITPVVDGSPRVDEVEATEKMTT